MKPPCFLVFPVTYRCNCRCRMCSIWARQGEVPDLPLALLEERFAEPILSRHLRQVNLTGGEPFLRPDLRELVELLVRHCPRMENFSLASNGVSPDRVEAGTRAVLAALPDRVPAYWSFSLDGPREVHDHIRGRVGAYDALMETVRRLLPLRQERPGFQVGFNATLSRHNWALAGEIRAIGQALGVGVGFTTANVVDTFIDSARCADDFALRPDERLELARYFDQLHEQDGEPYWGMVAHMLRGGARTRTCLARRQGVLIDGDGTVYHCGQSRELALGNLRQETFRELWTGPRARQVARLIDRECAYCLTNCYPAPGWRDRLRALRRRV